MQRLSILVTAALLFVIAAALNLSHSMVRHSESRVSKYII